MCLVTKNGVTAIKGLNTVPVNRLIVETSTPLALARMRAIRKVETEWFAFIDDDVEIDSGWYKTLAPYMKRPDVGAVEGIMHTKGLGPQWDDAVNDVQHMVSEVRAGQRGFTHNTLIRTELVKDWTPPPTVSAWEDYLLTQHILGKGYRWIRVPTHAVHVKTWRTIWSNALWGIKGRRRVHPPRFNGLIRIGKLMIYMLRILASPKLSGRAKQHGLFFQLACIHAYLKSARQ